MVVFPILKKEEELEITKQFTKDLESFTFHDKASKCLRPVYCCVCDGIPTSANWFDKLKIPLFDKYCHAARMQKKHAAACYPDELVAQYTVDDDRLEGYILSPQSIIDPNDDTIIVCKPCAKSMKNEYESTKQNKSKHPPAQSIANGYLIGDPPIQLSQLTEAELALVSRVRIICQSWVFFAGAHQQIKGWHTFFKNRTAANVTNLEQLSLSGMKGQILVVLWPIHGNTKSTGNV
jgi:hypothetical protein